jgi:hypothetical protein
MPPDSSIASAPGSAYTVLTMGRITSMSGRTPPRSRPHTRVPRRPVPGTRRRRETPRRRARRAACRLQRAHRARRRACRRRHAEAARGAQDRLVHQRNRARRRAAPLGAAWPTARRDLRHDRAMRRRPVGRPGRRRVRLAAQHPGRGGRARCEHRATTPRRAGAHGSQSRWVSRGWG